MTVQQLISHPLAIKLTVDDFLLLDEAGALEAYEKTELLDGTIVAVSPQHSAHYMVKTRLLRILADACDALQSGLEAWVEGSIAFPPYNVPIPDVFVTDTPPVEGLTLGSTVVLVVEVSSTSVAYDLGPKKIIYATNAVPEYWVVDVEARAIHQFWSPADGRYGRTAKVAFGERIDLETIQDLSVDTRAL